jgi:uncharacterized membrane protein YesL
MLGSAMEKAFHTCWTIVKLNLFFVFFSLGGLVIAGTGPALQMAMDLFQEFGINSKEITFKRAYQSWKNNFKAGNINFYIFLVTTAVLAMNLYLSVQLQGLLWFMSLFILAFALVLTLVLYLYMTVYTSRYDMTFKNKLKLSFITTFMNFGTLVKLLFGLACILVFSWNMKGLLLFATVGLIVFWTAATTRHLISMIDEKLEGENEEESKQSPQFI